jgi:ribosomal protein L4
VPQKVDDLGLRTALSVKWREGSMSVIDRLDWAGMFAKEAAKREAEYESGSGSLFEEGDGVKSQALLEEGETAKSEALQEREHLSSTGIEPTAESSVKPEQPSRPRPSTNLLNRSLAARGWTNALFILGKEPPREFTLSARNLPDFEHRLVRDTDIYTLLKRRRVILDLEAVGQLEDWLDAGMTPQSVRETGLEQDEDVLLSEEEAEDIEAEAQALVGETTIRESIAHKST